MGRHFGKRVVSERVRRNADELLDAYLRVEDADRLHAEYVSRGAVFTRPLGDTPWHSREFVVKDCDGRLLAFGARLE